MAVRRGHQRQRVQRKNYRIDMAKLEHTQRILGTRTETETIHRALDLVAEEAALVRALWNFVLKGGGHIEVVDARPLRAPDRATVVTENLRDFALLRRYARFELETAP